MKLSALKWLSLPAINALARTSTLMKDMLTNLERRQITNLALRSVPNIFCTSAVVSGLPLMGIKAIKFRMEQYLKGCNDMMEKVCVTCQQAREDDKDSSSFKVKRWQFGYPGQGMSGVHYPNCYRAKKNKNGYKKPQRLNPKVKAQTFVMVDEEGPARGTRSATRRRRSIGPCDQPGGSARKAKRMVAPRELF
ncbi:hypothetical protein TrST_g4097 [Triparma strigata]|uniref:Uncharacterized protein n=2 Tax=Triparma TaxID=722752 RepID=A0A9W7AT21_9STRA|nr:hypothetical protein TrST_g4097 [Triparma strigata]